MSSRPSSFSSELPKAIDPNRVPDHVCIVMDGNGRWAKERGMPRLMGHQKGAEAVKRAVTAAIERGIPYLTVWAFSTENWRRPEEEVSGLLSLMGRLLKSELAELHAQDIRLRVIGEKKRLPKDLLSLIDNGIELTKNNKRLNLTIAFDYGGRDDILQATRTLATRVKNNDISVDDISEDLFSQCLFTADLPDPDLFIRTSGVYRISNYLMWQLAYTELVFLDVHWPDFKKEHLEEALMRFQSCERKFGRISAD